MYIHICHVSHSEYTICLIIQKYSTLPCTILQGPWVQICYGSPAVLLQQVLCQCFHSWWLYLWWFPMVLFITLKQHTTPETPHSSGTKRSVKLVETGDVIHTGSIATRLLTAYSHLCHVGWSPQYLWCLHILACHITQYMVLLYSKHNNGKHFGGCYTSITKWPFAGQHMRSVIISPTLHSLYYMLLLI